MKNLYGFTLPELMVTIALAAILVTMVVPSFSTLIKNNRTTTQINTLLGDINLARSEAIKRGVRVAICSSADQATCAASTNWATGWIVFIDQNNNGTFQDDADANLCEIDAGNVPTEDCLLRTRENLTGNTVLTGSVNTVQYQATGSVAGPATLTLTPPSCINNQERVLTITQTGRASISESTCP